MEKKLNYVYLTINKINGKCYVGSHGTNKENDTYLGSGKLIENAIIKYKSHNFIKIKLKHFETILEARKVEAPYIKIFDTLNPNGYNISPTGGMDRGSFGLHSEETKQNLRLQKLGKTLSKRHRESISKGLIGNTYRRGCTLTEEHKNKISQSLIGIKRSDETKEKHKQSKIGKKHKLKMCPYCNKNIPLNNYNRYHGEKCKNKK